jgi:uncharacterized protein
VIVADTSGLLALYNATEPSHRAVAAIIENEGEHLVVSPFVIAELEYLVATRVGQAAAVAVARELGGGAYALPGFDGDDLLLAADVMERYRDHAVGMADASLVVLADRFATRRMLTLDRRRFTIMRTLGDEPFELLPAF